jgi:hypothetical protein
LAYEKQVINNYEYTIDIYFMQAAIENIKNDIIKNKFLYQAMWYTLLDENITDKNLDIAKRLYFDHSSDEKNVAEIIKLINASEKLKKGNKLPMFNFYNYHGKKTNIAEVIKNKKTILYTWPKDLLQIENFAKRINYLEKKYPGYFFIGINSKNSEYNWKNHIKSKKLNFKNQFMLIDKIDWLDINFSRAILVDQNGIVQNNMTHLSSKRFEKQLKNF